MSHYFMEDEGVHAFMCDGPMCGKVAGMSHDKGQALKDACVNTDKHGWMWIKPNYKLLCPRCLELYDPKDIE